MKIEQNFIKVSIGLSAKDACRMVLLPKSRSSALHVSLLTSFLCTIYIVAGLLLSQKEGTINEWWKLIPSFGVFGDGTLAVTVSVVFFWLLCALLCCFISNVHYLTKERKAFSRVFYTLKTAILGPYIRWYRQRDEASMHMFASMAKHKKAKFLGISHNQLEQYFKRAASLHSVFKTEEIDIYFASLKVGRLLEAGKIFDQNVARNKMRISSFLLSNPEKFPHLKSIRFHMCKRDNMVTGSYFGDEDNDFEVMYRVLLTSDQSASDSMTMKVHKLAFGISAPAHDALVKEINSTFGSAIEFAVPLGEFTPSEWNRSAEDWARLCSKSNVMRKSFQTMVEFACSNGVKWEGARVMDVACASGETSCLLLEKNIEMLTLVDSSPNMLRRAVDTVASVINEKELNCTLSSALCYVPNRGSFELEFQEQKYDIIVLHQALPSVASTKSELKNLAEWCYSHLSETGCVVLTAHNTVVRDLESQHVEYGQAEEEPAIDLYRKELEKQLEDINTLSKIVKDPQCLSWIRELCNKQSKCIAANDYDIALRQAIKSSLHYNLEPMSIFECEDIINAFTNDIPFSFQNDFFVSKINVDMDFRRSLWHCEAIARTAIDTSKLDMKQYIALVDSIIDRESKNATKPRYVGCWIFKKEKVEELAFFNI